MATWRYEISLLVFKNISLVRCTHAWNILQHSKRNFVSPRGHAVSSIHLSAEVFRTAVLIVNTEINKQILLIKQKLVKNLNWRETDQLAIYKAWRSWIWDPSSGREEDYKSRALTITSRHRHLCFVCRCRSINSCTLSWAWCWAFSFWIMITLLYMYVVILFSRRYQRMLQ